MADPVADTLAWYDRSAADFAVRTAGLDLGPLYDRFLVRVRPGGRILDAGCGVGRDALAFAERGYAVVAFDASAEMVRIARERTAGQAEILQMRFEDAAWRGEFDGVWACASLLHVPAAELPAVAWRLATALRPSGALYMSFKHGTGERVAGGGASPTTTSKLCAPRWAGPASRSRRFGQRPTCARDAPASAG